MEVKNSLALRKKRELLGALNKRKMSLRKTINRSKQSEFQLDITQITKCVFLGSLCLKPVPHLFDSPLLLEELDMTVGNVPSDISVNNENQVAPESSNGENTSISKETPKKNSRKKCLNVPKIKKKPIPERNEPKPLNVLEKFIKSEPQQDTNRQPPDSPFKERPPIEQIFQKIEPQDVCSENEEETQSCEMDNNNEVPLYEMSVNMKQTNDSLEVEEGPTTLQITNESEYDFHDIDFEEELLDIKMIRTRKPPAPSEVTPETTLPDIKSSISFHYEDVVRFKREPTPELILSDSDDDTLDQLMFNIMDIKVNPNDFDKEYYMQPSGIEEYEYNEEFIQKEDSLDENVVPTCKEKKYVKRTPQCKICSKVFPNYLQLKKHKEEHNGDKPYLCLKCNESHTTLDQLLAHLRTHQGKRPYVCKKCNKGFKTTKALENHQPVHVLKKTGPQTKVFKCEVCGKEFRKLCDLERHTRVHTGEKPSVCNICNKRFQQAHNLNKHLLIHTKEKPFQCDICNKKFGRNDVLNRHLLTHSVRKPNDCDICLKSFIRVSQLQAHKKKYHSD